MPWCECAIFVSSPGGYSGCFQYFAIISETSVNIFTQGFAGERQIFSF